MTTGEAEKKEQEKLNIEPVVEAIKAEIEGAEFLLVSGLEFIDIDGVAMGERGEDDVVYREEDLSGSLLIVRLPRAVEGYEPGIYNV